MTREEEITKEAEEISKNKWDFIDDDYVIPFRHGAKWADSTMIEKAAKWIATKLLISGQDQLLDEFKRAMEE